MRRKWRMAAVCAAFLLALPMGCGAAEEGRTEGASLAETDASESGSAVQDTVSESTSAVQDTVSESGSAVQDTVSESTSAVQDTASEDGTAEESGAAAETLSAGENSDATENSDDMQAEDKGSMSAGAYTWHPETDETAWNASNGETAFTVSLEYPVFEGETDVEEAINAFYREWVREKLDYYDTDPDSPVLSALEFREADPASEQAPWADGYSVAAVTAVQGVISIRQDNYLYMGGAHGMPGRENHIFSGEDGSEVTLLDLTPLSEAEVNELAKEQFLSRIEEHPEDGYFEDAADTVNAKTDFLSQTYLTQEGVVFYAQPYEIGPYAAGFIEVTVP